MKKIIISAIAILFFLSSAIGQCKYKSSGSVFSLLKKHTDVSPKTITKPKIIFDKFFVAAREFFIKSNNGKDYFGFLFGRSYSKKFDVISDNPLILMLAGGHNVKLLPTTNYEGRRPGLSMTDFVINPVYSIDEAQIELIANNEIISIRFYITSEEDIDNTDIDDVGRYFDFEINSENFKSNMATSANCFLQNMK